MAVHSEEDDDESDSDEGSWAWRQVAPMVRLLDGLSLRVKQLLVASVAVVAAVGVIVMDISIAAYLKYSVFLLAARSLVMAPPASLSVGVLILPYVALLYTSKAVAVLVQPLYCAIVLVLVAVRTVRYYYPNGHRTARHDGHTRPD